MLIPIKVSSEGTPEWGMIELNGELCLPDNENNSTNDMELGSVHFANDSTPIMILGSHELKGSVVTLKQPFAVLKKRVGEKVDYEVVGVVTKKLLFDQYPKSIMR
jgi:hypothetical protein